MKVTNRHALRLPVKSYLANHVAVLELRDASDTLIASVQKSIPSSTIIGNLLLLSDANSNGGIWSQQMTTFRNGYVSGTNLANDTSQDWGQRQSPCSA